MLEAFGVALDSFLQGILTFGARQQQRIGERFAVNTQRSLLAQGENQIHLTT